MHLEWVSYSRAQGNVDDLVISIVSSFTVTGNCSMCMIKKNMGQKELTENYMYLMEIFETV